MSVKILKEQRKMCISLACVFGECPLYFSALKNSQNVLRFLFSQSQFDHLRYNSLTLALSQKLVVNLLDPILLSLIVWPHRNFRRLLILSIGSAYIHVKMTTSCLSRNMITTHFRHVAGNLNLLSCLRIDCEESLIFL